MASSISTATAAAAPRPVLAPAPVRRAAAGWVRGVPFALFWTLVAAILLLPILLFLLVAFSPALFDQGPAWFSLSGFQGAFAGPMPQGLLDTLPVGVSAALASAGVGFAVAWTVHRTRVPGRRVWSGACSPSCSSRPT